MSDRVFKCIILMEDLSCWNCSDIWYCLYRFFGSNDSEVPEVVQQFLNGSSLNKQLVHVQFIVAGDIILFFVFLVKLEQVTCVSSKQYIYKSRFLLFPTPLLQIGHLVDEAFLLVYFLVVALCFLRDCLSKPGPGFFSISPHSKIAL